MAIDYKKIVGSFLLNSTVNACVCINEKGEILFANNTFKRFTSHIEISGTSPKITDYLFDTDSEKSKKLISDFFENEEDNVDHFLNILDASGHAESIQVEIQPIESEANMERLALLVFRIFRRTETKLIRTKDEEIKHLETLKNQLELAIQTANLGIAVWNYKTGEIDANNFIYELSGISIEEWQADKDIFVKRYHPEDRELILKTMQGTMMGESVKDFRHRIIGRDGNVKHMSFSSSPMFDQDGNVEKTISVLMDRTKDVEIEAEIKAKHQQLENITNHIPGLVLRYYIRPDDTDGVYFLSDGVKEVYGVEKEDALNNLGLLWDKVLPEDVPGVLESLTHSKETLEVWNHKFRIKHPNGEVKYLQATGTPEQEEDGSIVWDTLTLDITTQVLQENELKEHQAQFERFTDQLQGIAMRYYLKPDGSDGLDYLSKGVEVIYEVDRDEALQNVSLMWNQIHPDDLTEVIDSIQESAKNLSLWENVHRLITPSGKVKYLSSKGLPQKQKDGTIIWDTISIEITKQIKQQKEIQEKQELLQSITDHIPGVVLKYKLDEKGNEEILYISDGVEEIYGIPKEVAKQNFQLVWDRKVPEDIPKIKAKIREAAETLSPWEYLYRYYDENEKIRYLQGYGTPIEQENGETVWNAITIDVTNQVTQENIIQAKQKQLQNITDKLPGVVLKYCLYPDHTDRILYISKGVKEVFGLEEQPVLDDINILWEKFHEDIIPGMKESILESALNLTPWEYVCKFYKPTGGIGYIKGYGVPQKMEDGSIEWDSILLDVTQQKEAEEIASKSNFKLRSYIDSSPLAIYQIDPDGNVTDFWNPSAQNLFGWEKASVLGSRPPHMKDEHNEEFYEIIEDIRITKKPKQYIVKRTNKYNEELTLEITASPLFNDEGKLTDLLIIANDMTELEEYRETLEKALREKELLLQEVHHRVKNNLAIISGLLELQVMKEDQNRDVSLLIEARNRIHSIAMVHEQLYQDMDFSHINPANYYERLLTKLGSNALSEGEEIEYDLKFEVEHVSINRAVPLGLLINELFTNSIKHAFNRGSKNKVTLHFYEAFDQIKVVYADNGPGFRLEEIRENNSIGWQLIETLLLQLDSEYELSTEGEFRLEFTFEEATQGSQALMA